MRCCSCGLCFSLMFQYSSLISDRFPINLDMTLRDQTNRSLEIWAASFRFVSFGCVSFQPLQSLTEAAPVSSQLELRCHRSHGITPQKFSKLHSFPFNSDTTTGGRDHGDLATLAARFHFIPFQTFQSLAQPVLSRIPCGVSHEYKMEESSLLSCVSFSYLLQAQTDGQRLSTQIRTH